MNTLSKTTLIAMLLSGPIVGAAQGALKADPAYLRIDDAINLSIAKPEVNVNLPKFLLTNAASEFKGGPDDPFAKIGINVNDLIKDIKLIRVMVIEASEESEVRIPMDSDTHSDSISDSDSDSIRTLLRSGATLSVDW